MGRAGGSGEEGGQEGPRSKVALVKAERRGSREAGVGAGTGEEQARERGVEVEEKGTVGCFQKNLSFLNLRTMRGSLTEAGSDLAYIFKV